MNPKENVVNKILEEHFRIGCAGSTVDGPNDVGDANFGLGLCDF